MVDRALWYVKNLMSGIPKIFEPRHEISNNVVCATSKGSDQPAHTCSLFRVFASHLKEVAQAGLSLHLSKCHIVGNHMSRLIFSCQVALTKVTVTCPQLLSVMILKKKKA